MARLSSNLHDILLKKTEVSLSYSDVTRNFGRSILKKPPKLPASAASGGGEADMDAVRGLVPPSLLDNVFSFVSLTDLIQINVLNVYSYLGAVNLLNHIVLANFFFIIINIDKKKLVYQSF